MTFPARNSLAKSHFTPDTTETGVVGSKPDPLLKGRSAQTPPAEWAPLDQASGRGSCWGSSKPGSPGRPPGRGVSPAAWRRGSRRRIPPRARTPRLRPHIGMRDSRSGRPAFRARLVVLFFPSYGSRLWERSHHGKQGPHGRALHQTLWASRQAGAGGGGRSAALPHCGVGSHSFRGGGAAELSHGGLGLPTLSAALRLVSERSTTPHVLQALHSAATDGAMRAAVRRSRARGRAGPWPPPPPGVKRRRRSTRSG